MAMIGREINRVLQIDGPVIYETQQVMLKE